jgi:hypothetical protein
MGPILAHGDAHEPVHTTPAGVIVSGFTRSTDSRQVLMIALATTMRARSKAVRLGRLSCRRRTSAGAASQ